MSDGTGLNLGRALILPAQVCVRKQPLEVRFMVVTHRLWILSLRSKSAHLWCPCLEQVQVWRVSGSKRNTPARWKKLYFLERLKVKMDTFPLLCKNQHLVVMHRLSCIGSPPFPTKTSTALARKKKFLHKLRLRRHYLFRMDTIKAKNM